MTITMEMKQFIEKIANLREADVGPTEENVKQKILVPLLELLGHERKDLEFEYPTRNRRGKIDVLIKNVPSDCKVIIDTKNYTEDLNDHIEQIKEYAFSEAALLAVITNGTEIRIYSPLRGVAFERSLLYSLKRQDLIKESVWVKLSDLLHKDSLQDRGVIRKIEEREREIKDALSNEEDIKQNFDSKAEGIDSEIEIKEVEIERLKTERENLAKEQDSKIAMVWDSIGLPLDLFRTYSQQQYDVLTPAEGPVEYFKKARRVTLQELADVGLVKDGQLLYFYHTRLFRDEQAKILAPSNRLEYRQDGRTYSVSELANILLTRHGFKNDKHGVAGPKYWKTEEGMLLDNLNEEVRGKRGDRK